VGSSGGRVWRLPTQEGGGRGRALGGGAIGRGKAEEMLLSGDLMEEDNGGGELCTVEERNGPKGALSSYSVVEGGTRGGNQLPAVNGAERWWQATTSGNGTSARHATKK
jgi:hypothetical protein